MLIQKARYATSSKLQRACIQYSFYYTSLKIDDLTSNKNMETKKLVVPLVVGAVLLGAVSVHYISHQQPEKIYGETTTVVGKKTSFVERYYLFPINAGGNVVWRRSSHPGVFLVYKVITSNGNKYEIMIKQDLDMIKENDVIKQFTGIPYDVERGNGVYYACTYAPVPGILCWLELWRNGTYLKDIKVYKPPY